MRYSNEYGTLVVEPVTEVMPVRDIGHSTDYPEDIKFSLDTGEQIVLITENRLSQIAFPWLEMKEGDNIKPLGILIVYESASMAQVVRIVEFNYTGPDSAEDEIERVRPKAYCGPIPV